MKICLANILFGTATLAFVPRFTGAIEMCLGLADCSQRVRVFSESEVNSRAPARRISTDESQNENTVRIILDHNLSEEWDSLKGIDWNRYKDQRDLKIQVGRELWRREQFNDTGKIDLGSYPVPPITSVASIAVLPQAVQNLGQDIKTASESHLHPFNPLGIEYGGISIQTKSGKFYNSKFTSWQARSVASQDFFRAFEQSLAEISQTHEKIVRVFHLHTHPKAYGQNIDTFSYEDLWSMKPFQDQLLELGIDVPIEFIVASSLFWDLKLVLKERREPRDAQEYHKMIHGLEP